MFLVALIFIAFGWRFALFGWDQNSEMTGINMLSIHVAWPLAGICWVLFLAGEDRRRRRSSTWTAAMGPLEVALILFGVFAALIIVRVPVAFALGLACIPVFFIDDRLTPFLLLNEMLKSYNSFLLLAIPFFMLAANLMNSAGITEKLINLSRALVGHLPGRSGSRQRAGVDALRRHLRFVDGRSRGRGRRADPGDEEAGLRHAVHRRRSSPAPR